MYVHARLSRIIQIERKQWSKIRELIYNWPCVKSSHETLKQFNPTYVVRLALCCQVIKCLQAIAVDMYHQIKSQSLSRRKSARQGQVQMALFSDQADTPTISVDNLKLPLTLMPP